MNVELAANLKEITIEELKLKVRSELSIDQTSLINLLDKRTLKTLEDATILIINDGKLFAKNSLNLESKEKQFTRRNLHSSSPEAKTSKSDLISLEEEIQLIISYRCSYDNST